MSLLNLVCSGRFKEPKCFVNSIPVHSIKPVCRSVCCCKKKHYLQCYEVLGLPNDADQDAVRRAFIDLCKKYHPDSISSQANSVKFQQIDSAYRSLQNKFSEERWNVDEELGEYGLYYDEKKRDEEVKEFDIKHQAPQHRQYLSFAGVGSGTPSQRLKQYNAHKTINAAQNVYNHRIQKLSNESLEAEKAMIVKDQMESKKIKTGYGIERLVEDLIQESMAKGEFDNLKGAGKPLKMQSNYNPYIDLMTHKMNQIMIENGFVPEWITLQKEISDEIDSIKKMLSEERRKFGPLPFNEIEQDNWRICLEMINENVVNLNAKIDKFNLVVPILDRQMIHFNTGKLIEQILKYGDCADNHQEEHHHSRSKNQVSDTNSRSFFGMLFPFD